MSLKEKVLEKIDEIKEMVSKEPVSRNRREMEVALTKAKSYISKLTVFEEVLEDNELVPLGSTTPLPEDEFEAQFAGNAAIAEAEKKNKEDKKSSK